MVRRGRAGSRFRVESVEDLWYRGQAPEGDVMEPGRQAAEFIRRGLSRLSLAGKIPVERFGDAPYVLLPAEDRVFAINV